MVTNKSYRYNFGFRLLHYHLLAVHNVQTLAGIAHVATMEVEQLTSSVGSPNFGDDFGVLPISCRSQLEI